MGIPSFFKQHKPKQFSYKPLYYNQQKEEREERNKEIARELGVNQDEVYTPKIQRGTFNLHKKKSNRINSVSNIRLIIIILVLFFIAYLILYR